MDIYTLYFTDECGTEHEIEKEFWCDKAAIDWAYEYTKGTEGLWSYTSLYKGNEELLPAQECWW